MKNIIDSAHAPSDAFNNLKKTLIQIEYKIFLFNRAAEALKSLLILGPRILFLNIDIS
jgi:two-component SAPR family response regulator